MRQGIIDRVGVHLRAVQEEDFPLLTALRCDRSTQHLLLAYPDQYPPSSAAVRDWIARRTAEPGGAFLIIADGGGHMLGFGQIVDVHQRGRFGKIGFALLKDVRGRGFGSQAMRLLIAHARDVLGLRKLLGEVHADNSGAMRLYEAVGFRRVGVLHAHYDDGTKFHDVILVEIALDGSPTP